MKGLAFAAAVLVAFAAPSSARAALFFVFDQPTGAPNARVTVRTGATATSFRLSQRVKPFQRPVRLCLVRYDAAAGTGTRNDSRLHFLGVVVPDRRGRGLLTFSVPPLDAGAYEIAY